MGGFLSPLKNLRILRAIGEAFECRAGELIAVFDELHRLLDNRRRMRHPQPTAVRTARHSRAKGRGPRAAVKPEVATRRLLCRQRMGRAPGRVLGQRIAWCPQDLFHEHIRVRPQREQSPFGPGSSRRRRGCQLRPAIRPTSRLCVEPATRPSPRQEGASIPPEALG